MLLTLMLIEAVLHRGSVLTALTKLTQFEPINRNVILTRHDSHLVNGMDYVAGILLSHTIYTYINYAAS